MTRDPIWDALKAHSKEKFDADRARHLQEANRDDDGGWTKHSPHHWTRIVGDKKLQYWPSRKKWQLGNGRAKRGLTGLYKRLEAL